MTPSSNSAPAVNAGVDLTLTLPTNSLSLTAVASDPDGDLLTVLWEKVSGPSATIAAPQSLSTAVTGLVAGTYAFRLTVTDAEGKSSSDAVTVTVNAAPATTGTIRTLVPSAPNNELYCPNGCAQVSTWQPGDVVRVPAGHWSLIDLGKIQGSADHPITLINDGGLVTVETMRFRKGSHIRLLGNGHASLAYGFKIGGANGVALAVTASDFEVAHIEATNSDIGIMVKRTPDAADPDTLYPAAQKNISIHDNFIHDIDGEGMYIGHTYPNSDPYNGNLTPSRLDNVKIYNNKVLNTTWDGIQLSNCQDQAEIHHNTVTNFGTINMGSQQAGIILGGNCSGDVHHNVVTNGTGNGIQVFGYGVIKVYNNTVTESGLDGTAAGQEAIYARDTINQYPVRPKQALQVTGNLIQNSTPSNSRRGAIRLSGENNNSLPALIQNNQLGLRGVTSPTWQNAYILPPISGSTVTGNTLIAY